MKQLSEILALAACAFIGAALVAFFINYPRAQPVRLIGMCQGQLLAALEESQFPADCDWIEAINFKGENQ